MRQLHSPVAVIGAGLQGSCIALELARRGTPVVLVDADEQPVNRASLRNEGKIHLGLTYANDATLATGRLQLEGALAFRRLLARWIGPDADDLGLSRPFHYLIARDSVLGPDALEQHYAAIDDAYQAARRGDSGDYLGTAPDRLFERLKGGTWPAGIDPAPFGAAFATPEVAVHTARLAGAVRRALGSDPAITFAGRSRVESVRRRHGGFEVECRGADGILRIDAGQVVNASWESRIALDAQVGIEAPPGWLYRLKYRVIVRVHGDTRGWTSVTVALGRYGDVVVRNDDTLYLSWYPAALRGWTHEATTPPAWEAACRGNPDEGVAADVARATIEGIGAWYPAVRSAEVIAVDAGIITAYGRSDVDDKASELHQRTRIGVVSAEGFHSVETGKLTTAPLFAMTAADRVTEALDD